MDVKNTKILWVDEKNMSVNVKLDPREGHMPDERVLAIVKFAEQIEAKKAEFIEKELNPLTKKLVEMVKEYNCLHNEEYAKQFKPVKQEKKQKKTLKDKIQGIMNTKNKKKK